MNLYQAREEFIKAWGNLGSNWGINKTMAQIHALMLVAPRALSAEEIMEELNISRGNVNMNVRSLIDWGLVYKESIIGERKEYFIAEKDMWKVSTRIMQERRRRELEPIKRVLADLQNVKDGGTKEEIGDFVKTMKDIEKFSKNADKMMTRMVNAQESWFGDMVKKWST